MSTHHHRHQRYHTISPSSNPLDFILALTISPTSPRTILIIAAQLAVFRASILTHHNHNHHNGSNNVPSLAKLETLLAASKIPVIFAPSLLHLRAYLSTIPPQDDDDDDGNDGDDGGLKGGRGRGEGGRGGGILAVWGLIAAHRETSELSVQGLGQTVASVVDAGVRSGRRVILGEPDCSREQEQEGDGDDGDDGDGCGCGCGRDNWSRRRIWEEELPLLNATVNVGSLEGAVAGRTVAVGRVLGRWFRCPPGEHIA